MTTKKPTPRPLNNPDLGGIKSLKLDPNSKWSLHFGLANETSPIHGMCEAIEREVFREALGYHDDMWQEEFPRFDPQSLWVLLVRNDLQLPVGAMRLILGRPQTLKFAEDLGRFWNTDWATAAAAHGLDPQAEVMECATLSVLPQFRTADRRWPVKALCSVNSLIAIDLGIPYGVQLQDVAGIRALRTVLRVPFEIFANLDPVEFNGPVQPTLTHLAKCPEEIATSDAEFKSFLVKRDQSGRNGTTLPPIDLTENGPLALYQRLLAESPERGTKAASA